MSKLTKDEIAEIQELIEMNGDPFDDDDYVIVLGSDGELKSVMLPENMPFRAPKKVEKILKMFDITDIDNLGGNATLH